MKALDVVPKLTPDILSRVDSIVGPDVEGRAGWGALIAPSNRQVNRRCEPSLHCC